MKTIKKPTMKQFLTLLFLFTSLVSIAQSNSFSFIQEINYVYQSDGILSAPNLPGISKPNKAIYIQGQLGNRMPVSIRLYFGEKESDPNVALNSDHHRVDVFYKYEDYDYFLSLLEDKENLTILYYKNDLNHPKDYVFINKSK